MDVGAAAKPPAGAVFNPFLSHIRRLDDWKGQSHLRSPSLKPKYDLTTYKGGRFVKSRVDRLSRIDFGMHEIREFKNWRRRRELNPGEGICSPSPVPLGYGAFHSCTLTCLLATVNT